MEYQIKQKISEIINEYQETQDLTFESMGFLMELGIQEEDLFKHL